MTDENIIQTAPSPVELTRAEDRIRQLSDKVELTSKERDEMKVLVGERDKTIADLQKENAFNSGFSDILGTHPAAKDHKDEIKAKVLAGYTPEDAAFAVLGKAGKLGNTAEVVAPQVAGGPSAVNNTQTGEKSVQDMTQAERRARLEKELINQ